MVDWSPMSNLHLIGIIGSLRSTSVNAATARAAVAAVPDGVTISLHDVADVPLYNGDTEQAGLPPSVAELHDVVGAADGMMLFSPEYNGSFPAVTKNVIDWLSRPPRRWEQKPMTLIVTSPGPRAGKGLRSHFSAIMAFQPIRLFDTHGIGGYGDKIDEHGALVDPETVAGLTDFIGRFAEFCRQVEPVDGDLL